MDAPRALQTLVDFVHRDRLDSPQRPQFPSGVEALATPLMAIKWTNSDILARIRRAQMEPDQTIVTDLSPEFSGQPTAASYLGGTWIMAAKGTKDTDATLDLVTYLTGLEHTLALAEATTTVPARKSAEKAPYVQNPLLRPFYESLRHGWSVPQHPKYTQIRAKVIEATREAMRGRTPMPSWPGGDGGHRRGAVPTLPSARSGAAQRHPNPFLVETKAGLVGPRGRSAAVPAVYDGEDTWKVRLCLARTPGAGGAAPRHL